MPASRPEIAAAHAHRTVDLSLNHRTVPAKKHRVPPGSLSGPALLKETCRRLRAARGLWDAHRNAACRRERERALALYERLTAAQRAQVPQHLRTWLRYRSEKYFGEGRDGRGANSGDGRRRGGPRRGPDHDGGAGGREWEGVGR